MEDIVSSSIDLTKLVKRYEKARLCPVRANRIKDSIEHGYAIVNSDAAKNCGSRWNGVELRDFSYRSYKASFGGGELTNKRAQFFPVVFVGRLQFGGPELGVAFCV